MGSEAIAHEAEGRMGYCLRGHEGERWAVSGEWWAVSAERWAVSVLVKSN